MSHSVLNGPKNVGTPKKKRAFNKAISGTAISPGFARGMTYLLPDLLMSQEKTQSRAHHNVKKEVARLDQATLDISRELIILAARVDKEIDKQLAEVFGAHEMILNDQLLREELRREIADNLVTAGSAVKSVFTRWENRFLLMESSIAREKADDLRDISIRLRNALAGIKVHPLENIPEGCILVTQRLLPSDTIFLSSRSTAAVLLEHGSMGSHSALFTRQMGVPCISDIHHLMTRIPDNTLVLVDANQGRVTLAPSKKIQTAFQKRVNHAIKMERLSRANASKPAVTKDGVTVKVNANVGCRRDAVQSIKNGADGIGLYRLEQFYIGRALPPTIGELVSEVRHTLGPFHGRPVCVRLLDIGSDKPLPFIGFLAESNPALGRRGIRLMREYPELLQTQLQALLRLSDEFEMQILIPMVALPGDAKFVRDLLVKQCKKLDLKAPQLGAMIETPAAALAASAIAPYVDFMSFGTNDLTQYVFAADRENAAVEGYFNDASDAIFRLIAMVHADVPRMPLSICGELAGRRGEVLKLLRAGISSLSVAPPLLSKTKEAVRHLHIA